MEPRREFREKAPRADDPDEALLLLLVVEVLL